MTGDVRTSLLATVLRLWRQPAAGIHQFRALLKFGVGSLINCLCPAVEYVTVIFVDSYEDILEFYRRTLKFFRQGYSITVHSYVTSSDPINSLESSLQPLPERFRKQIPLHP
jgi:hypothetical protein